MRANSRLIIPTTTFANTHNRCQRRNDKSDPDDGTAQSHRYCLGGREGAAAGQALNRPYGPPFESNEIGGLNLPAEAALDQIILYTEL